MKAQRQVNRGLAEQVIRANVALWLLVPSVLVRGEGLAKPRKR